MNWDDGLMANRPASALMLRDGDRDELERLTRASSVRAGLAQRARIVLLAADGMSNTAIAERVGVSRPTVLGGRDRYQIKASTGWPTRTGRAGPARSTGRRCWRRRWPRRQRGSRSRT